MLKIILDTDVGCDCDDVGAMAILAHAVRAGDCSLLGVGHAVDTSCGRAFIRRFLKQYGIDVPVARCALKGFMSEEKWHGYAAPYEDDAPADMYPDAVRLYRRLLAENDDITFVTIGSFVNVSRLMQSGSDEISPLDGLTLIERSVNRFVCMAGNFENYKQKEFNVLCDAPGAVFFTEHCPVPAVYLGFETGLNVRTGHALAESGNRMLKDAYKHFDPVSFLRPSWDPMTVYYAICGEGGFMKLSEPVTVRFDAASNTVVSAGGKDRYLSLDAEPEKAAEVLDAIIQ